MRAKDCRLNVRVTPEVAEALERRAAHYKISRSKYLRTLLSADPKRLKREPLSPEVDTLLLARAQQWATSILFYSLADLVKLLRAENLIGNNEAAFAQFLDKLEESNTLFARVDALIDKITASSIPQDAELSSLLSQIKKLSPLLAS